MKTYFDKLTQPEINILLDNCNFTSDKLEDKVFLLAAKGKSDNAIATQLNLSVNTVSRRKRSILEKIECFCYRDYKEIVEKLRGVRR